MMEKQIKETFDQITMEEACKERILGSIRQHRPGRRILRYGAIAAACLLIAALLLTNPNTVQALEEAFETVSRSVSNLFQTNTPITQKDVVEGGKFVIEHKEPTENHHYSWTGGMVDSVPSWLEATEDGLYFTANGERIEIGSLITEEVPFSYTYTSPKGIIYYFVVGGTYTEKEELLSNVGWGFWAQNAKMAKTDPLGSWLGGFSTGRYDPEAGANRPWYDVGKEILGIPYP